MTKEIYTIELDRPEGVTVGEMVAYIKEAVNTWGGQQRPEDPLFYPWSIGGRTRHKGRYPAILVKRRFP